MSQHYHSETAFAELGEGFFDIVAPARFSQRILRFRNQPWAARLGLGELGDEEWIRHFAEFEPLPGNLLHPMALRYHGHQFRSYNPDLGDGRGFLYAQLRDPADGRLLDLGTKGSGQTPWSRSGDGRLTLKGAVREALATEMLEMLGVNTSKTFSIVETGESLERHDEPSPTRAAVLVRLSYSHVRFGSFQRHAAYRDTQRIEKLLDYAITHFYPAIAKGSGAERAAAFLREVTVRTARTCAAWMIAGFVHGVLNTDNMNITGESFDYGPWRFLPSYDPRFTAAYFDETGLYAFGRQPESVVWNLEQLASSLSLLISDGSAMDPLVDALNAFAPAFNRAILEKFLDRLGLQPSEDEADAEFLAETFSFLHASQVGYDQFYFDWHGGVLSRTRAMTGVEREKYSGDLFSKFETRLQNYTPSPAAAERLRNPYFARPRPCSMLIDEVEWIWEAISAKDDWTRFEKKIEDIRRVRQLYGRELFATP
ncbi:MAG: YdiU family protein [Bdellovibrionaceae bacterium]|nr:YdiU family protein [Pseudobdellovibrionaceae bacterium]